MKKPVLKTTYQIRCANGCGKVVALVALPVGVPLLESEKTAYSCRGGCKK